MENQNFIPPPTPPGQPQYSVPPPMFTPAIDYREPIRSTANKLGIGLLLTFGVSILLSYIVMFVVSFSDNSDLSSKIWDFSTVEGQIFNMVSYIAMFFIPMLICFFMLKIPAKIAFPMRKPTADTLICAVGISFGASLVGSILVAIIYSIISVTTGYGPVYPFDELPRGFAANAMFFVNIAILPAFIEELFFRGVVMQSLRRFGDKFALITSAIIFGLAHGNLIQAPNAFILGLVLGYFVLYSGSLWPGIVVHFVNNAISVILQWTMEDTTTAEDNTISLAIMGTRLIVGLVAFFYFKAKQGAVFTMPRSSYPLREGKKYSTFFFAAAIVIYILITLVLTVTNLKPLSEDLMLQ